MTTKLVDPSEYIRLMRQICGKTIWRVSHPSDAILFIDAGDWVWGEVYGLQKEVTPHKIGEYQLMVWGDWQYFKAGTVAESSELKTDDTRQSFLHRIEAFADTFPHRKILGVDIDAAGTTLLLTLDQDAKLLVKRNSWGWAHLDWHVFDTAHQVTKWLHIRPTEENDGLEYSEAP